jgi:hypothetical protein
MSQRWKEPTEGFTVSPVNSPAALLHWIHCLTSLSKFCTHMETSITIAGEWLQNLGLRSAPMTIGLRWIFSSHTRCDFEPRVLWSHLKDCLTQLPLTTKRVPRRVHKWCCCNFCSLFNSKSFEQMKVLQVIRNTSFIPWIVRFR